MAGNPCPMTCKHHLLAIGTVAVILGGKGWYLASPRMPKLQIHLSSLLLLAGAIPFWIVLMVIVPQGFGFGASPIRYAIAPAALGGVTWALQLLLRTWPDRWAIAALLAGVICFGTLWIVAWLGS